MGDENMIKPADEVLRPIIDDCFTPHADALAAIVGRGDIAVVVYRITEGDAVMQQALRDLGWDGASVVFPLQARLKKQLIEDSEQHADHVTARWLRGGRTGRVFLWSGSGTLLVNFRPGEGYSIEPGSTDASRAQT